MNFLELLSMFFYFFSIFIRNYINFSFLIIIIVEFDFNIRLSYVFRFDIIEGRLLFVFMKECTLTFAVFSFCLKTVVTLLWSAYYFL